jgi:hypothetical protein
MFKWRFCQKIVKHIMMRSRFTTTIWTFGFVIQSLGSAIALQEAHAGGPLTCDFSDVEGPILTGSMPWPKRTPIRIRIPASYLDRPFPPRDGEVGREGTLLLSLDLVTFRPHRKEFNQPIKDDWVSILINPVKPLSEVAQITAVIYSEQPVGTVFALKPAPYGLLQYQYKMPLYSKELFVHKDSENITDVISCFVKAAITNPNCSDRTTASGLDIGISYPKSELENWNRLRQNARKLLACLIIN